MYASFNDPGEKCENNGEHDGLRTRTNFMIGYAYIFSVCFMRPANELLEYTPKRTGVLRARHLALDTA